ncbi:MAG: DUF2946 family protein [Rhodoferax sp.]|nr:DUF2946 family protein [Rhodoferax sp.]
MDEIVKQAMIKWPNVPDCFGWLGLDARGNWYMRDDKAQAAGPFAGGQSDAKGSRLQHEKLIAFIERNYAGDEQGRWYFQNGPQRVYVELEVTPWVWRLQPDFSVKSHTGQPTPYVNCLIDEYGWLYLETKLGFGLVHTQDTALAAEALDAGAWSIQNVQRDRLSTHYRYVLSPQARALQK